MSKSDRHPTGERPVRRFQWISRIALALALLTVFTAGLVVGRSPMTSTGGASQSKGELSDQPGYDTFQETWDRVNTQYVDINQVAPEDLMWGASAGLVDGLGDTGHSRFLDPKDAIDFIESIQGELIGIGVQLRLTENGIYFPGIIAGGPADEAGVKRGDVLLTLDGDDVTGLELNDLDMYLDGVDGSKVTMEIYRPVTDETLSFDLVQRPIEIDPVTWTMLPNDVALIRLSTFSDGSADAFRATILESLDAGATGIVFDLRDNGGGIVEEARQIASQFLPEGTVIFRENYSDGTSKEYLADAGGVALDIPLVVLINRFSASSSEFVASALSESGRASLIGQTTFGTGTILSPQQLDDGSLLVLGTGLWETPDGVVVWHTGLDPDQEVRLDYGILPLIPGNDASLTDADLALADDTQVDAALGDLAGELGGTPEASPEASPDLDSTPVAQSAANAPSDSPPVGPLEALAIEPDLVGSYR